MGRTEGQARGTAGTGLGPWGRRPAGSRAQDSEEWRLGSPPADPPAWLLGPCRPPSLPTGQTDEDRP